MWACIICNEKSFYFLIYTFCLSLLDNCLIISWALCVFSLPQKWQKAMKKIPNNIKKNQTKTVITITTHRAKVDVHMYEATNGQATTLTGFLATNRLDVPRERKGQRWEKMTQTEKGKESCIDMGQPSLFSLQGEPTSSTPPSPHTAGERTHFRQLTSCLSAQAIWSKSSWCTKESKMIYCNMKKKNHSKEQEKRKVKVLTAT